MNSFLGEVYFSAALSLLTILGVVWWVLPSLKKEAEAKGHADKGYKFWPLVANALFGFFVLFVLIYYAFFLKGRHQ